MKMQKSGFTLVELIIAMAVGMIILGAIYAATNSGQRSSMAVQDKIAAQQDARAALEIMALEIRMASYNPNGASGIWVMGPSGTPGTVNQSYRGIQEAGDYAITIQMDIRGNAAASNSDGAIDDPNENIRYALDTANQYITRDTGGGGQQFLGAQIGNARDVRVVNAAAGIPLFRYFDGDGTRFNPVTAADIPDIRRIEITLVVDTENIDPNLGQRRRTIYATSVIPRNHALD